MFGIFMWILFNIVPAVAVYTVMAGLLYRPVYKHFYEKQRLIKVAQKDRWGDFVLDERRNKVMVYRDHEKAHEEALWPAAIASALWPFAIWPLFIRKFFTPVTPARKAELAEAEETRKMEADLRRKQTLAKMEKELGIDNTIKALDYKVKDQRY